MYYFYDQVNRGHVIVHFRKVVHISGESIIGGSTVAVLRGTVCGALD